MCAHEDAHVHLLNSETHRAFHPSLRHTHLRDDRKSFILSCRRIQMPELLAPLVDFKTTVEGYRSVGRSNHSINVVSSALQAVSRDWVSFSLCMFASIILNSVE